MSTITVQDVTDSKTFVFQNTKGEVAVTLTSDDLYLIYREAVTVASLGEKEDQEKAQAVLSPTTFFPLFARVFQEKTGLKVSTRVLSLLSNEIVADINALKKNLFSAPSLNGQDSGGKTSAPPSDTLPSLLSQQSTQIES